MIGGIFDVVSSIFSSATGLIDELITTDEEKGKIKAELQKLRLESLSKVLQYEEEIAKAKRDIIVAEAKGESWLQRNWRPLLMVIFTFIIFSRMFGLTVDVPLDVERELFEIIKIGIGGYIVGRTGEKLMNKYGEMKNDSKI